MSDSHQEEVGELKPREGKSASDRYGETKEEENEASLQGKITQIKNVLNDNKVKLWLPPYYVDGKPNEDGLLELSTSLSASSLADLDAIAVLDGLKTLQRRAVDRVNAKKKLDSSGQIRLKLIKPRQFKDRGNKFVDVDHRATGEDLTSAVGEALGGVEPASLRIICAGRVITKSTSLVDQGIRPGASVMVLVIDCQDESLQILQKQRNLMEMAKMDAELLGSDSSSGLVVADQSGKSLNLPPDEHKALIIAMSLHEKGRAAIKRDDFNLALVLLLEASEQFGKVRSELLENVDNFGLLNLDVVWCYVRLGNIDQLTDAVSRLDEVEESFKRTYGESLERVKAVKGTAAVNERALVMRFLLLRSIAAYHQGLPGSARSLLRSVRPILKELDVSEESVAEVVAMGFTTTEARLALRETGGKSVADAAKLAERKRNERMDIDRAEAQRRAKRHKYGKTPSGSWVNIGFVDTMLRMGFSEDHVVAALRQTDNDLNAALDLVSNKPDLLEAIMQSMLEDQQQQERDRKKTKLENDKEKKKEAALNRLRDDLGDIEDYLDLTLEVEKALLERYWRILGLEEQGDQDDKDELSTCNT